MRQSLGTCLTIGFGLAVLQLALAVGALAPGDTMAERYFSLLQGRSAWFQSIAERGYATTDLVAPSGTQAPTTAFFPAYPLAAGALARLPGVDAGLALLVTSQLACWGAWTTLLLLLRRWETPWFLGLPAVAAVFANPAAFLLVAGCSESLFLFATLGFLFWICRDPAPANGAAAGFGFVMAATRLAGLPLALLALACSLIRYPAPEFGGTRSWLRKHQLPLLTTLVSAAGSMAYLIYLELGHGGWAAFAAAKREGWGIGQSVWGAFDPAAYLMLLPRWLETAELGRFAALLHLVALLAIGLAEVHYSRRAETLWRERLPFFLAALILLGSAMAAAWPGAPELLLRYLLAPYACLTLGLVHAAGQIPWQRLPGLRLAALVSFSLLLLGSYFVQINFAFAFTRGLWPG
jgi:hypothetical protein